MLRKVEFIGSGYEVVGAVMVDTPTMAEAYEAAEKWYKETGQNFHYCEMEIPKEYAYNEHLESVARVDEGSALSGDWHVVGIAVEGRAYVDVRACSPVEAETKANVDFCDADLGELECIDWKRVNVEDSKGRLFDDDDLSKESAGEEQEYSVGFAVDGRVYVQVNADNTVRAVEKACQEVCDMDFGKLECIDWRAVNVEDARGRLYDDERSLFGPTSGSLEQLISDAEKTRKDIDVKNISKHFEEPSL